MSAGNGGTGCRDNRGRWWRENGDRQAPRGSAAGFNAEQVLQLGQLLNQGADRLEQRAAAGSGCGNGCGCDLGGGGVHGGAARGRVGRRGVGAAGGGGVGAGHQTITW